MPRKTAPARIRKPITLTLAPAVLARVDEYCEKNAITRSQLVELALERMLINEEGRNEVVL